MAVITLRKGSATGPEIACTLGYIDLDALEAGTHYEIAGAETITLTGGGELKVAEVNILAPGLEYVNLDGATELLPEMRWNVGAGVAEPSGTWTPAESPGTQPADWDLHWRDKYYTESTYTHDGRTIITYNKIDFPGSWDYRLQYYANSDHAALFWTPNNGVFGVRQQYESAAGSRAGIICGGMYSNFGNQDGGSAGPLAPRLKNLGGQQVGGDTIFNAPTQAYYPYRIEYAPGGATQPNIFHGHVMLLEVNYNGTRYIAFAVIGYSAADELEKCGFWMSTDKFWISDDIEPGTPGDWGERTGALNPSPSGSASFSVDVGFQPFPTVLNDASFAGNSGGLYVWALTQEQYGHVNGCIWDRSFLDRIADLGRNPGDGIIGAHYMPAGFSYATTPVGISLYGVRNLTDGGISVKGHKVSGRTYDVDLGTVTVDPIDGKFADYDARAEIYLPFIGTQTLDIKKIMRGTLHLQYRFDVMTGDCVAWLYCTTHYPDGYSSPTGTATLLCAHGNAARPIPYAYSDGGVQAKLGALSGALAAGMAAAAGSPAGLIGAAMSFANMGQQQISHSSITGSAASMGLLRPFIWLEYPIMINPTAWEETIGRVSMTGGTVGTTSDDNIGRLKAYEGLQIFEAVDTEGINCTQDEAAEIEKLLKGGVFL